MGPRRDLPPRERRRGLAALAVAVVLLGALMGVWVSAAVDDRAEVVVVASPVAPGQQITGEDLTTKPVSGVEDAVPAADLEQLVGLSATVGLVPGQVLTSSMVTNDPVPGEGRSLVGLSLSASRMPSGGLEPGTPVRLVALQEDSEAGGSLDDPTVLVQDGRVHTVGPGGDGGSSGGIGGDAGASAPVGGTQTVTVIVPQDAAARVAAYAAADRVAVVRTADGAASSDGGD